MVSGERANGLGYLLPTLPFHRAGAEGEDASKEDAACVLSSIAHPALFSLSLSLSCAHQIQGQDPRRARQRLNESRLFAAIGRCRFFDFWPPRRLDVIDRCDLPRLCSALLRNRTSPPLAPPLPDDITLGLTCLVISSLRNQRSS